ncbi:ferredoxin [Trebonia sp.]|uniref:ferredoxin n=1 Tax=Trebonia sp. TaxID=2767075 RepID=UPI0026170F54|nr:ferredoxin [Trebonia sp.]
MSIIVRADQARCMGHARCNSYAPGVFKLDDNGYVAISQAEVAPEDEAAARHAVAACPERALSIEEVE